MQYTGWIYKWTNKTNGKIYIGQTMNKKGYKERWSQHISNSKIYKGRNYFYNAIRKYGKDNFTKEILYELKSSNKIELKSQLDRLEIELIDKYNTTNPTRGYNSTKGGEYNVWNSLDESDERYVKMIERIKNRSDGDFEALRKEVVLVNKEDGLIKHFKSLTEASNYLKISLSGAGIICRCGDNKGGKFMNHSGNTQCGNKLRHIEDWLDGLTVNEIRKKYSNSPMESSELEEYNIEGFTIETDINGDIVENSFLQTSKNIQWFYEEGYKKLTKKQIGFIKGEIYVPVGGRARIIRTIQKRLGVDK